MKRTITLFSLILAVTLLLSACNPMEPTVVPQSTEISPAEISNPAAKYCVDQGFKNEIRTATDGSQYGVCTFPDETECEEWSYYRGECKQGQYKVAPIPVIPPDSTTTGN